MNHTHKKKRRYLRHPYALVSSSPEPTSRRGDLEIKKVKGLLSRMRLLEFTIQACERFGEIRDEMEAAGTPIGDFDIMIASVALAHNQPIITRDTGHFEKIPGLTVETW